MKDINDFIAGKVPAIPLEKIALSLSGGGYRAASFHLGGMAYLNHLEHKTKPLLEKVEMISTVSGGTIPGVVYTLMIQKGRSFNECYHFLLKKLETLDLVATGIEKLNPGNALKNSNKSKNLINAFAEQYDEHFTEGATLGEFEVMKGHLKTVVFNATEFSNAINFRFRNPDARLKTGNDAFRISREASAEIKLADVIASSSCFPGGFEPLLWPDDYIHGNSPKLAGLKTVNEAAGLTPTGIMDGGIYDNQGVESILMYKKGLEKPYFDLIIVSDVASPDMEAYKPYIEDAKEKNWKALTLSQLLEKGKKLLAKTNLMLWAVTAFFLLLPIFWGYGNNIGSGLCIALALVFFSLIVIKHFAVKGLMNTYGKVKAMLGKKIPLFYFERLSKLNLGELSIHRAEPLIINRLNSLLTLTSVVFLKVVRRLNYKRLYEQPNYDYRRATTLIKELTEKDWTGKNGHGDYNTAIGSKIKAIVEQAASFGTTLWFTEEERLEKMLHQLVITGQVTMCYNIKVYLEELIRPAKNDHQPNGFDELPEQVKQETLATLERCREDWAYFKLNPSFLFEQLKEK